MGMTELAQLLGRLIRERGGYLPSHDDWLEEKAEEIESLVRATAPQYKVGDIVELTMDFGVKHTVTITKIEKTFDGDKMYYTDCGTWFSDGTPSRLIK